MTKDQDFIRGLVPPSRQLAEGEGPRATLLRVARPFACSVAIHLGLGAVVVAGSAALGTPPVTPVAWLDLEPAVIPPEAPAPIAAAPRPRPVRPAPIEPRAPEPLKAPTPITPPEPEERVAPPAPPSMAATPREAPPEPPSPSVSSAPPSPIVAAESKAPDADRVPAGAAAPSGPRDNQERGADTARQPVVASRPPDAAPGGPIVRAARPRGGYQVRPLYPESARRAGIQGTTLLRIFIERDGRVSDVTVQRSAGDQSLDQAASDAVRRWRFEPALNSSGPVAMWAVVPVEFRISD
jgi:periplasmic protein TonB